MLFRIIKCLICTFYEAFHIHIFIIKICKASTECYYNIFRQEIILLISKISKHSFQYLSCLLSGISRKKNQKLLSSVSACMNRIISVLAYNPR